MDMGWLKIISTAYLVAMFVSLFILYGACVISSRRKGQNHGEIENVDTSRGNIHPGTAARVQGIRSATANRS
jgi:hypothetical protein